MKISLRVVETVKKKLLGADALHNPLILFVDDRLFTEMLRRIDEFENDTSIPPTRRREVVSVLKRIKNHEERIREQLTTGKGIRELIVDMLEKCSDADSLWRYVEEHAFELANYIPIPLEIERKPLKTEVVYLYLPTEWDIESLKMFRRVWIYTYSVLDAIGYIIKRYGEVTEDGRLRVYGKTVDVPPAKLARFLMQLSLYDDAYRVLYRIYAQALERPELSALASEKFVSVERSASGSVRVAIRSRVLDDLRSFGVSNGVEGIDTVSMYLEISPKDGNTLSVTCFVGHSTSSSLAVSETVPPDPAELARSILRVVEGAESRVSEYAKVVKAYVEAARRLGFDRVLVDPYTMVLRCSYGTDAYVRIRFDFEKAGPIVEYYMRIRPQGVSLSEQELVKLAGVPRDAKITAIRSNEIEITWSRHVASVDTAAADAERMLSKLVETRRNIEKLVQDKIDLVRRRKREVRMTWKHYLALGVYLTVVTQELDLQELIGRNPAAARRFMTRALSKALGSSEIPSQPSELISRLAERGAVAIGRDGAVLIAGEPFTELMKAVFKERASEAEGLLLAGMFSGASGSYIARVARAMAEHGGATPRDVAKALAKAVEAGAVLPPDVVLKGVENVSEPVWDLLSDEKRLWYVEHLDERTLARSGARVLKRLGEYMVRLVVEKQGRVRNTALLTLVLSQYMPEVLGARAPLKLSVVNDRVFIDASAYDIRVLKTEGLSPSSRKLFLVGDKRTGRGVVVRARTIKEAVVVCMKYMDRVLSGSTRWLKVGPYQVPVDSSGRALILDAERRDVAESAELEQYI